MTDNEIINELQCASEWFTQHGSNTNTAIIGICGRAVDLIKHQQAEIERVKKTAFDKCLELSVIYTIAKDKAIKDFAKQVKMELCYEFDGLLPSSIADRIDNLVKEMIGDQE